MFGKLGGQSLIATKLSTDLLEGIVNDLSNLKSLGHKKTSITFAETLNGELVKYESKDFSQGPLKRTAEPFDVAIDGKGFFEVELPDGRRAYTRVGSFQLSSEGELITREGYRVLPEVEQDETPKQQIKISTNTKDENISRKSDEADLNLKILTPKLIVPSHLTPKISEDGTILAVNSQTSNETRLGRLNIVTFNNPKGLESIGRGFFLETNSSGTPIEIKTGIDGTSKVKQGFVEFSNVDIATSFLELSQAKDLITAQLKILKAIDKLYENVNFTISRAV